MGQSSSKSVVKNTFYTAFNDEKNGFAVHAMSWKKTKINARAIGALVEEFGDKHIYQLHLNQCPNITDAELAVLAEAFPDLPSIYLEGCTGITGEGVEVFASSTSLISISLTNCPNVPLPVRTRLKDICSQNMMAQVTARREEHAAARASSSSSQTTSLLTQTDPDGQGDDQGVDERVMEVVGGLIDALVDVAQKQGRIQTHLQYQQRGGGGGVLSEDEIVDDLQLLSNKSGSTPGSLDDNLPPTANSTATAISSHLKTRLLELKKENIGLLEHLEEIMHSTIDPADPMADPDGLLVSEAPPPYNTFDAPR